MSSKYLALFLVLLIPLLSVQTSCKKNTDPESPLIFMNPEEFQLFADVGEVISFDITSTSESGLASFKVESKLDDGQSFTVVEYEEVLSGVGTYNKLYEMQAPQSAAGLSLILTFTATDVNGLQTATLRRLWVTELPVGPVFLNETTGHMMYSKNSANPDSYNLETGMAGFSTLTDSSDRDMEDFPLSDTTMDLSLSWFSPAGGKFVKFNGFNYANATDSLLIDGYNSGAKFNKVDNLEDGDIILTKLGSTSGSSYAVLKITAINDPDSTDTDYYMFNVKN